MKDENYFKKDLKSLYKLAWKYFSIYVRNESKGICYTCKRKYEVSQLHASHFQHGGNNKFAFWCDFDKRNVKGSCVSCNLYKSGNLNLFAEYLIRDYGPGIIAELNALKWKKDTWGKDDLIRIIKFCKLKAINT
jgi:hypothetical protein